MRNQGIALFLLALPWMICAGCGGGSSVPSASPTPVVRSHGERVTFTRAGLGTKPNANSGGYTFFGQAHLLARFSDFTHADGPLPAANTQAGWQAHLDGLYPILTATDFNAESAASGATLELTGGPSASGRWLKRNITQAVRDAFPSNYRLRNWNLWDTNAYEPQVYLSCYLNLSTCPEPGKLIRMYWNHSSNLNDNLWVAFGGDALTARAEGGDQGSTPLWADQPAHYGAGTWMRLEVLADFEQDAVSFYRDGVLQTDVSNQHMGTTQGWIGTGGWLNYALLGNTIDADGELGQFIGHAMPYLDFSFRRLELADAPVWEQRSQSVPQIPVQWSDPQLAFVVNQGPFQDLRDKHLFLLEGMQATYLGPLP